MAAARICGPSPLSSEYLTWPRPLHKQLLLEFGERRPHYGFLEDHKSVQINEYQGYSFSPSKLRRVLGVCTSASSVSFDPRFYRTGKCEAFGMKHALFEAGI